MSSTTTPLSQTEQDLLDRKLAELPGESFAVRLVWLFYRTGMHPAVAADPQRHSLALQEDHLIWRHTLTDHLWGYLRDYAEKHRKAGNGFGFGLAPFDGVSRTLSARYFKDGAEVLIPQPGRNPRRLTPRECARLMGFPDSFRIPVSDTQAYKQFGNAVVPGLVEEIGRRMNDWLSPIAGRGKK